MNAERFRHLMKAHVKGHTRVVNGKVVYIHDYDAEHNPQGRMAHLHERTAIGKHKNGTHYLRATDAEDGKIIQEHADKLGIKVGKRRSGANHFGRTGAYDHYHMDSPEDAVRLHEALSALQKERDEAAAKELKHPGAVAMERALNHKGSALQKERDEAKKNSDEKEHYSGGDKIRYTGKTEMIHGGKFHEFEYLEGHKKGQKGVNAHGPDGLPGKPPEKPSGIVTPQIAPLGSGSGQPPAAPPKVETIPEAKDQVITPEERAKVAKWAERRNGESEDDYFDRVPHLRRGEGDHRKESEDAYFDRLHRARKEAWKRDTDEPVTVRPATEGQGHALPPKPDSHYDKTREAMAAGTVEAHEAAAKHYEGLGDKKQAEDHRLNAENIRKMAEANPRPKGLKAGIPFGHPSTKGMAELKSRQLSNQRVSRMHMGAKENFGTNGATKEAHEATRRAYREGTAEAHKAASDAHFKATQGHEIAENRAFGKGDTSGWKGHSRMRDHHTAAYSLHDTEARKIEDAAKTPEPANESKHDPAKAKYLAARASRVMEESRRTRELSHGTTHIHHAVNAHQATTNATAASHEAQANGNHRKAADLHLEASNAHFKAAEHARLKGSAGSEEEHLDQAANHKAIAGEHRSMA